jgi:hypothetical protein
MRLRHLYTLGSLATIVTLACASGGGEESPNGNGGSNSAGQNSGNKGGAANGGNGLGGSTNANGGSSFGGTSMGGASKGFGGANSGGNSSGGNSSGGSTAGGTGTSGGANQGGSGNGGSGGRSTSGGTNSGGKNNQGGNTQKGGTNGNGGSSGGNMNRGGQGNGGSGQGGTNGAGGAGKGGSQGQGGTNGAGGAGKGGSQGQGGSTQQCSPPSGGSQGYTTRFWDCCKPSCSWPGNVPQGKNPVKSCNQQNQSTSSNTDSACSGGGAYACWDMAPWAVSDTLAYGYAAFNGSQCGQCYELKFTGQSNSAGNDPGSAALCGKTMIVQVINIGNITQGRFDLMIPGGGVGQFNACTNQWNVSGSALGEQYGGVQLTCQKQSSDYGARKSCTTNACNNLFKNSNQANLLAGCKWGVDWLQAADNPKVVYRQVSCPNELTSKSGLQ